MFDAFEDKLIYSERIERMAKESDSRQDVYSQVREATSEEIAAKFNEEPEFDNDLFKELADRAGVEMDDYIDENGELDRDKWQKDVANKLEIELY